MYKCVFLLLDHLYVGCVSVGGGNVRLPVFGWFGQVLCVGDDPFHSRPSWKNIPKYERQKTKHLLIERTMEVCTVEVLIGQYRLSTFELADL